MTFIPELMACVNKRCDDYPREVHVIPGMLVILGMFVIPHPIYLGDVCYPRVTHVISKFPGMGMRISVRIFVLGFR